MFWSVDGKCRYMCVPTVYLHIYIETVGKNYVILLIQPYDETGRETC